jgi:N-acetylglucosamine transport system permease protein
MPVPEQKVPCYSATAVLHRPRGLIVMFLAPALLLYTGLFAWPMLNALYLSLFRGSSTSTSYQYVGFENFRRLFADTKFWSALGHNAQFVVIGGIATLVLALFVAFGLTRCGRGRDAFRLVFLFPNIMSIVATTTLWSFALNPSFGVMNGLLGAVGLGSLRHAWLGEPSTALASVILIHVWSAVGFYIVLFYAGMLRIPADYSEAARIDGATLWQEFRHITLPLIRDMMQIACVYIVINSVNVFALVFLINERRSGRYTSVLLTYMYDQAFTNGNFGYACAIGVAVLVILLAMVFLVQALTRRETIEL